MQISRKLVGQALAAVALLAIGGGIGAATVLITRPVAVMAPAVVTPIGALAATSAPILGDAIVTVRGKVAEVYGNGFVLADGSGRTLIAGGRHHDRPLVETGQTVTVQGRVDDGVLKPSFLVDADGRVTALGRHWRGHGHRRDHDPERRDTISSVPVATVPRRSQD